MVIITIMKYICIECGKEVTHNNKGGPKPKWCRECYLKRKKRWSRDYGRLHYKENREKYKETYKKNAEKLKLMRKQIVKELGNKCVACGGTEKLVLHETHGKSHRCSVKYYKEYKKDFIVLCDRCHVVIHRLALNRSTDITKLLELSKLIKRKKKPKWLFIDIEETITLV